MNRTKLLFHKYQLVKICFLLAFALFPVSGKGQFYEYGQEPGNVKWLRSDSENFRVIYPAELERDALKILILLEKNYLPNSSQLSVSPGKIPVILHTHTVRSNGFVIWAPKRMELFSFPDINGISQEWYSHLTLHEFRHVAQVEKMNKGFTKILTTLLGEQGVGPAAGLSPFWLLEGDAVYAETSLSESGRGRTPSFEMGIKARLLDYDRKFSFSKACLGSYRDYVPNHYQYGYEMVSFARMKYGQDIWSGAFGYTGKYPFLLNPLYFYLKKQGAGSKNKLYHESLDYLEEFWTDSTSDGIFDDYESLNKVKNKLYTSYKTARLTDRSSFVCIKSSYDITDRFVEVFPDGREKTLYIPGYLNSGNFDYAAGKILWDEFQPGIRFRNQSFSVLKEFDTRTGQTRYLSMNSRYSSPAYSFSADTIVCVETSLSNDFYLTFISALDAGIFTRVPTPGNIQIMDPAWIEHSDRVVVAGLDESGKSLWIYDRSDENWERIYSAGPVNITRPVSGAGLIYFNASHEGRDNIYSLKPGEKEARRITRSEFGAFEPEFSAADRKIYFSNYTSKGFRISSAPALAHPDSSCRRKPNQPFFAYGDKIISKIPGSDSLPVITGPKKYSGPGGLFHIHSWSPFYFDYTNPEIVNPEVSPGITLLSQNLLSTAVSQVSLEYKDGQYYFHSGFTYKGWLPVLDLSWHYGGDPFIVPVRDSGIALPEVRTAADLRLAGYIPLSFNLGRWTLGMQPSLSLSRSSDYFYYSEESAYRRGISYLDSDFYLYFITKSALRDLVPRWGFITSLRSFSAPFEKEQRGSVSAFRASFYLPGLLRNHGIRIQNQWQWQNPEKYLFSNIITFPRGMEQSVSESLYKFSMDYYAPLLYPDLSLEGLLYLKRIRAQFFYDYLYGNGMRVIADDGSHGILNGSYGSAGMELRFDYHLFRIFFPFSSGVRLTYLLHSSKVVPEFIYSIDLNRF